LFVKRLVAAMGLELAEAPVAVERVGFVTAQVSAVSTLWRTWRELGG
jgi:hypothetical protein